MKITFKLAAAILLTSLLFSCSRQKQPAETFSKSDFLNPPHDVRVHTWWHWLDGAITKDGITKDLESMNKQGVTQATILNVGLFHGKNFGVPQVKFNTPEWYSMFEWALRKADSLGITIGAHNCDGWSTSGGPWITPEKSMKQFEWTKSYVTGGGNINLMLPEPQSVRDFYKDVAVVAYKSPDKLNSFRSARPEITLNDSTDAAVLADGSPVSTVNLNRKGFLQFSFSKPFTTSKLAIHPRQVFSWQNMAEVTEDFQLSSSTDGKHFSKVGDFQTIGLNKTIVFNFHPVDAKVFRLELSDSSSSRQVALGEVELLNDQDTPSYNSDIPCHLEKIVSVKPVNMACFDTMNTVETSPRYIVKSDIVNLTDKMSEDGSLAWDAPEGNWTIIRFGYTSTGATNGPATKEGTGLECDKMDTSALNLHWVNFPQKLIDHAGKYAGNTFKFLLIDSWECGYQNWTGDFPEEFKKLRGYELTDFIPALCGETVTDPETTEGFLYDFRNTISDLIGENYYKHFGELCHRDHIEYDAEAIYGELNYPPLDIMKANSYIDLPMFEFWANFNDQTFIDYQPSPRPDKSFPAASAVIYDKPVIGTEAYTGMAHYSETPQALKPFGDRAFCMGLNQMILHSYVHQPLDNPAGMTLGQFASHFNRLNPWWQFASGWIDYQSRIQYILQKGKVQHDVLYYIGDQLPQSIENQVISDLPFGYSGQACNEDALMNMISVRNGKLFLPGGLEYNLLILPENRLIELATLDRIADLVKNGAVIYGEKPVRMLSLKNNSDGKSEFDALVSKLWGNSDNATENHYGKGLVIWDKPISQVLEEIHVLPDFSTGRSDSLNLMYIHKKAGDADVYFVFNQQDREINRECLFSAGNKIPEIWDPQEGTVTMPAIFRNEDGRLRIPVSFGPRESKIFLFRSGSAPQHIASMNKGIKQIFPGQPEAENTPVPEALIKGNVIEVMADSNMEYHAFNSEKQDITVSYLPVREQNIRLDKAYIEFHPPYPQVIAPVTTDTLMPLNDFENPMIKYFSGTSKYSIRFDVPEDFLASCDSFLLKINIVHATAEVNLNGVALGIAWEPGTLFDIRFLKHIGNKLDISIGNPYRNRFIGDFREYGEMKNIWSSAPVTDFLHKDSPLLENGLLSPVSVIGYGKH